jgi:hypothetical protein
MSNCLFEATLQQIEADCGCTPKYFVDIAEGFEACEGKQVSISPTFYEQLLRTLTVWICNYSAK